MFSVKTWDSQENTVDSVQVEALPDEDAAFRQDRDEWDEVRAQQPPAHPDLPRLNPV